MDMKRSLERSLRDGRLRPITVKTRSKRVQNNCLRSVHALQPFSLASIATEQDRERESVGTTMVGVKKKTRRKSLRNQVKQGGEGIIYDLFKQQREIKGGLSRPDSRLLRNQYGIISTGYDRNLSSRLLSSARVIIRGRKGVSKCSFHTKKLGDLSLSLRSGLPPRLPLQLWQLTFLSGKGGILDHSKLKIGVNWRC